MTTGRRSGAVAVVMLAFVLAVVYPGFAAETRAGSNHDHMAQAGKPPKPAATTATPRVSKQSPAADYTPNV